MGYFQAAKKGESSVSTTGEYDVQTLGGLKAFAESRGLTVEEDKPSLFSRFTDLLSRPLYASAGFAKAIVGGDENPLMEAWKGLKGEDKETYSDVLEELGVQNKWVRGGLGFALDIALDPATYFGGAIAKGALAGVKGATRAGLNVGRKFSPQAVSSLEVAGSALKDAFGHAFKFGYGTTAGVSDDVARFFNKLGIAKEEVIEKNLNKLSKFNDNTLKDAADVMFQNKSTERLIRKGEATAADYIAATGDTGKAVSIMKEMGAEIGNKLGRNSEELFDNYIPSIKNLESRQLGTGTIKVGPQKYLKEFEDKIKDEDLLKKPIEAYSRREFEVVRDVMAKDTLDDMVKTYGLSVDDFNKLPLDEQALYKPIYDQGYRKMTVYPTTTEAGQEVMALGKAKKPLGYMKTEDYNFVNNYMFPEYKTIDMLAKATGYDMFTRWFKTAVTSWFPAFHIRNYISGNVQNYQVLGREAFNPQNHNTALAVMRNLGGKGADDVVELGGKTYTTKQIAKEIKENFQGASRYISDIDDYIEELSNKRFSLKKIKDPGRKVGNFIETNQKAVAMVGALRQGKTMKEAVKIAEKAGFDYSKITKFESKVMRRLIPFYTFARKNAELQAKTLAKNPERVLNQIKFTKNLSEIFGGKPTEEDLGGLPPWALSGLGFKVDGDRYLTKFGLPLEEFIERINKPLGSTLSSANPLIKFPLESKMGYDFFREQELVDINKIAPATAEMILSDKSPDWLKELMNIRKVNTDYGTKYYASPKALHVLRNLPTSRLQNTLEKAFDGNMNNVDKWLAFLTGARIYDIDTELQKYFKEKDLREDIERELLQSGEGKMFQTFYIPKED